MAKNKIHAEFLTFRKTTLGLAARRDKPARPRAAADRRPDFIRAGARGQAAGMAQATPVP
jgi:hypothetical protein